MATPNNPLAQADQTNQDSPQPGQFFRKLLGGALAGIAGGLSTDTEQPVGGQVDTGAAYAKSFAAGSANVERLQDKNQQLQEQQRKLALENQARVDAHAQSEANIARSKMDTLHLYKQISVMDEDHRQKVFAESQKNYQSLLDAGFTPDEKISSDPQSLADFYDKKQKQGVPATEYTEVLSADGKSFTMMKNLHGTIGRDIKLLDANGKERVFAADTQRSSVDMWQKEELKKMAERQPMDSRHVDAHNTEVKDVLGTLGISNQDPYLLKSGATIKDQADSNAMVKNKMQAVEFNIRKQDQKIKNDQANLLKKSEWVTWTDPDGKQSAGSVEEAQARGVTAMNKLPTADASKVLAARQAVGLFHTAPGEKDEDNPGLIEMANNLNSKGLLGPLATRLQKGQLFTNDGLPTEQLDPLYGPMLTKLGLANTLLMNAHVGLRGSSAMLEHFEDLTPKNATPEAFISMLKTEANYLKVHRAMIPSNHPLSKFAQPESIVTPKPSKGAIDLSKFER